MQKVKKKINKTFITFLMIRLSSCLNKSKLYRLLFSFFEVKKTLVHHLEISNKDINFIILKKTTYLIIPFPVTLRKD